MKISWAPRKHNSYSLCEALLPNQNSYKKGQTSEKMLRKKRGFKLQVSWTAKRGIQGPFNLWGTNWSWLNGKKGNTSMNCLKRQIFVRPLLTLFEFSNYLVLVSMLFSILISHGLNLNHKNYKENYCSFHIHFQLHHFLSQAYSV